MQLQREDNIRNLSTLQFGLQHILPSLVKSANNILLSASQYAFILQSNLMQEAENLVHKCINDVSSKNKCHNDLDLSFSSLPLVQVIVNTVYVNSMNCTNVFIIELFSTYFKLA